MNRILIEQQELQADRTCTLTDRRAAHINDVLHAAAGQALRIGLIDGPRGTGTVLEAAPGRVTVRCEFEAVPESPGRVDILLALPRPKVLKRLWAPLASFGVGRIMITNAEQVERNYFDTHWLSPGAYRPLLIEGLEQAGRTTMPGVSIHRRLKPLVEDELAGWPVKLAAHPGAARRMSQIIIPPQGRVLLAVGPEAGWTEYEQKLLSNSGFTGFSMGEATLRSDVACISAMAVLLA